MENLNKLQDIKPSLPLDKISENELTKSSRSRKKK